MHAISKCRPVNAVGTARAIARGYSVFAIGGRQVEFPQETLGALGSPGRSLTRWSYGEYLKADGVFNRGPAGCGG